MSKSRLPYHTGPGSPFREPDTPDSVTPEVGREPVAWIIVPDALELKRCPKCKALALEGEVECAVCGCEPTDDSTWRTLRTHLWSAPVERQEPEPRERVLCNDCGCEAMNLVGVGRVTRHYACPSCGCTTFRAAEPREREREGLEDRHRRRILELADQIQYHGDTLPWPFEIQDHEWLPVVLRRLLFAPSQAESRERELRELDHILGTVDVPHARNGRMVPIIERAKEFRARSERLRHLERGRSIADACGSCPDSEPCREAGRCLNYIDPRALSPTTPKETSDE